MSMFNCPSMTYLGIMLTGFVLSDLSLCLAMAGISEQEMLNSLLEIPAYVLGCFLIFYILQRRELESFIREKTASIKQ